MKWEVDWLIARSKIDCDLGSFYSLCVGPVQRKLNACHERQELRCNCYRYAPLNSTDDYWLQLPACIQGQWAVPHGCLWPRYWLSDLVSDKLIQWLTCLHSLLIATHGWSSRWISILWKKAVTWRPLHSLIWSLLLSTSAGKSIYQTLVNRGLLTRALRPILLTVRFWFLYQIWTLLRISSRGRTR